jgi:hypothetical protein
MTALAELAAAARRVAVARAKASDPPPIDEHRWRALGDEIRRLAATGDSYHAETLIEGWERDELERLPRAAGMAADSAAVDGKMAPYIAVPEQDQAESPSEQTARSGSRRRKADPSGDLPRRPA